MMMKKIASLFLFTIIALSMAFAAGLKPQVDSVIDKTDIPIGGRIKLDVGVKKEPDMEVMFPDEDKKAMGDFSVIKEEPSDDAGKYGRVYILGIYTTGTHVIPPVEIKYKERDAGEWKTAYTRQFPVTVKSVLTGNEKDIKGLKGLIAARGIPLWVLVGALALLLVLIIVSVFIGRNRARFISEHKVIKLPHEIAYEELSGLKAKDLPGKGLVKEFYIELSDIIRRYVEKRFRYRAPEMTTEEFLVKVKEDGRLVPEHKSILKEFLILCDMVKFAKYGPKPLEIIDAFNMAEKFVDVTKLEEKEDGREQGRTI